jgi:hypothetical protein
VPFSEVNVCWRNSCYHNALQQFLKAYSQLLIPRSAAATIAGNRSPAFMISRLCRQLVIREVHVFASPVAPPAVLARRRAAATSVCAALGGGGDGRGVAPGALQSAVDWRSSVAVCVLLTPLIRQYEAGIFAASHCLPSDCQHQSARGKLGGMGALPAAGVSRGPGGA